MIPLFLSFSNRTGKLDPEEFGSWYSDHRADFIKSCSIGTYNYQLALVPADLKLIQLVKNGIVSKEDLENFRNENENTLDFILRIEIPENGNVEFLKYPGNNTLTYEERLKYYAFELQKNIKLINTDGQELSCEDYLFERSYGIQPAGTIRFSFDSKNLKNEFKVVVNDSGFDSNSMEFIFDATLIKKTPKLKYSKLWNIKK